MLTERSQFCDFCSNDDTIPEEKRYGTSVNTNEVSVQSQQHEHDKLLWACSCCWDCSFALICPLWAQYCTQIGEPRSINAEISDGTRFIRLIRSSRTSLLSKNCPAGFCSAPRHPCRRRMDNPDTVENVGADGSNSNIGDTRDGPSREPTRLEVLEGGPGNSSFKTKTHQTRIYGIVSSKKEG